MRKREGRIFFISFFGTLCVLALLIGIAEVDRNSRKIGFGDEETLISHITGKNWLESCNIPEIWYNNFILTPKGNAMEEL